MAVTVDRLREGDHGAVNRLGAAAYAQFADRFDEWERFSAGASSLAALDGEGVVLVARRDDGDVLGAVGYFGPGTARPDFFSPDEAVIRMLAVDPAARGQGVGRLLTAACIARAQADRAPRIALHTTPEMAVALAMYRKLGFVLRRDLGLRFGVPYGVYELPLDAGVAASALDNQ
jgi:ribosomal protein S18 acetylase RimI-like enzyme